MKFDTIAISPPPIINVGSAISNSDSFLEFFLDSPEISPNLANYFLSSLFCSEDNFRSMRRNDLYIGILNEIFSYQILHFFQSPS